MTEPYPYPDETLDPADWQSLRHLGYRMVDDMLDFLENIRDQPVWKPIPEETARFFKSPVPAEAQSVDEVYADFLENVLPYPTGNVHPRFWGWVMGTGTPFAMLAEMLAAGYNTNLGGGQHAGALVEAQVLDWLKELLHFPAEASGLLTSGGSMANLVGLTVARNHRAGYNLRQEGVGASPQPLVLYASSQVHSSVHKAVELLGLGRRALREIPVDAEFRMDVEALKDAIAADRAAGSRPFCVVGNAGTVNTGAFDDLEALADLCLEEGLWLHVDGAFGALVALAPGLQHLARGLERADSVAFDLHKWLYMPFEVGCVLVRSEEIHRHAFSLTPDYLAHTARGPASGAAWFSDYGVQLSRGFRALKVWMSLKEHGYAKFGRIIQQNTDQARYLTELVDAHPELERLAPVPLNIVCFQYRAPGLAGDALSAFNEELLLRLQESAVALPSYTKIDGQYALRVCITNHRTRAEDLRLLVDKVVALGRELAAEQV